MAKCIYCGTGTQLYINGVPVCLACERERETGRKPPYHETQEVPPKTKQDSA